jgi:hypothetical protein
MLCPAHRPPPYLPQWDRAQYLTSAANRPPSLAHVPAGHRPRSAAALPARRAVTIRARGNARIDVVLLHDARRRRDSMSQIRSAGIDLPTAGRFGMEGCLQQR